MYPSVAFSADDTEDWGLPLAGPGLLLDVPREGPWRQPPALHVEAAPGYRLRLSSGGQPLLWCASTAIGTGVVSFGATRALPGDCRPCRGRGREVAHTPGTERWWEAWRGAWGARSRSPSIRCSTRGAGACGP